MCFQCSVFYLPAFKVITFTSYNTRCLGDMSDTEDEHMKRAIQLSLQENGVDSEQDDIDRAIALSLQQEQHDNSDSASHAAADRVLEHNDDMRKAIALSLGKSVDQLTAREALGLTPETKDVVQQFNKRKRHDDDDDDAEASNSNNKKTKDQRHFWDGVVKLTHVTGFTGPNFIRFEDIVEKDKLKKAVITAMVVSMDWIEEQFPSHVNLCVVLHGRPVSDDDDDDWLVHQQIVDHIDF